MITATEPHIIGNFTPECFEGFLGGNDVTDAKRREAFESYTTIPNPVATDEEYRRTPPRLLKLDSFSPLPKLGIDPNPPVHPWADDFDAVVSVTENGIAIQKTSDKILLMTMDDASAAHPECIQKYVRGEAMPVKPRKLQALVDSFWNVGLTLKIDKNVVLEKGVLIHYHVGTEGAALLPRLLVVGGEHAEFSIVEHMTSTADTLHAVMQSREYYLMPGAKVKQVTVQELSQKAISVSEEWARIQAGATVTTCSLTLGSKVSKIAAGCDTAEPGAEAYFGGLYFANKKQQFDLMTLQMHSSPNTYSNMLYKGATQSKGYSVYQGIIQAARGAIGVDAYQTNNNLILDHTGRADSLPGLIIDADELACSHGATMGTLDADQIYYLRARGIQEADARRLLVMGFFGELVERIPSEAARERMFELIGEKLKETNT